MDDGQTKDEVYDLINQIMHEAAAAWGFFEQGDDPEAMEVLEGIRERLGQIAELVGPVGKPACIVLTEKGRDYVEQLRKEEADAR